MKKIIEEPESDPIEEPVQKDRSLIYWGVSLGIIILVMGYLALFVDDPWKAFNKTEPVPVKITDTTETSSLEKAETMTDKDVRKSLTKFIEAFYFDQRRGYFDPPSYFAPITETFYNYHNLTFERLKDLYWKRMADMENLKRTWIVSSLDFERQGSRIIATFLSKESYLRRSKSQLESGDFKMEMIINENGKIVSLNQIDVKNFETTPINLTKDTVDSNLTPALPTPAVEPANNTATPTLDQRIYDLGAVETQPEFKGGMNELTRFVSRNLRYPVSAQNANIQGKTLIGFTVEKNGELHDFKIVRGIGGGCDEEAIRVLKLSPPWKPGTIAGKEVRTGYVLPITFKVN